MASFNSGQRNAFRAQTLIQQRKKEKEEIELTKRKLKEELDSAGKVGDINSKFSASCDDPEQELKSTTIGLVTLDEMKSKHESLLQKIAASSKIEEQSRYEKELENNSKKEKYNKSTLSFDMDDDEEEPESDDEHTEQSKRFKLCKNPEVDTSFLPDREREDYLKKEKEQKLKDWHEANQRQREEDVLLTYSYWDGSGHRMSGKAKKGDSIQKFLQNALIDLKAEFLDLKDVTTEHLMFIKQDLIIPHHYNFHEFITSKACGRHGLIFEFFHHPDSKSGDLATEKPESTPAKICLRKWYDKNKHIYPASLWEPYDPDKNYAVTRS